MILFKTFLFLIIFVFLLVLKIFKILYNLLKISINRIKHNISHKINNDIPLQNDILYDKLNIKYSLISMITDVDNLAYSCYDKDYIYDELYNNEIYRYMYQNCLICPHYIENTKHIINLLNLIKVINNHINNLNNQLCSYNIYSICNNNYYQRSINEYKKILYDERYKDTQDDINRLSNVKEYITLYYIHKYLKCAHTYKDLFIDIFVLLLIVSLFSLLIFMYYPLVLLLCSNMITILRYLLNIIFIGLKISTIIVICFMISIFIIDFIIRCKPI
jgi:hypothetical protein